MNKIKELKHQIESHKIQMAQMTTQLERDQVKLGKLKEDLEEAEENKGTIPEKFATAINAGAQQIQNALNDAGWYPSACFMELRDGMSDMVGKGFYLADKFDDLRWKIEIDNIGTQVLVPIL